MNAPDPWAIPTPASSPVREWIDERGTITRADLEQEDSR
jgi:hypothetical protein